MCSIRQALEVTLGTEPANAEEGTAEEEEESLGDLGERTWAQLGGDSLAAIQFARRVSEACGVSLPVSYVLDKSRTLGAVAEHVQALVRCVPCFPALFSYDAWLEVPSWRSCSSLWYCSY